jgi:phosphate transport system permease protein
MEARDAISGSRAIGAARPPRSLEASRRHYGEKVIQGLLAACALISVLTTTAIVLSLLSPTIDFFQDVSFKEFFTGSDWAPTFNPPSFNVPPIVVGTLSVTFWGMLVAIPVGLLSAVYLSEYAAPRARRVLKPVLEVLAGIPTIVFGFFAITLILPVLGDLFPSAFANKPYAVLAAGLAVGLMIVPIIASISDDAMRAVPRGLREGAYALGAGKMTVSTRVVFPAAISGIVASVVLAASRAVGETMIVLLAAGLNPSLSFAPNQGAETMTAFIGTTATGDIPTGTTIYKTIFAVGALLFVMTLVMNLFAIRLVRRFREVYE